MHMPLVRQISIVSSLVATHLCVLLGAVFIPHDIYWLALCTLAVMAFSLNYQARIYLNGVARLRSYKINLGLVSGVISFSLALGVLLSEPFLALILQYTVY